MDITLRNITKKYGSEHTALTILKNVNAQFLSGKRYAIHGPSGIGKSTLLHVLARLDNVDGGSVTIGDTVVSELSEEDASLFRRDHIGMVFQFHHLLPEFTARENIMMPLLIRGVAEVEAEEDANRLLERVGLHKRASHRPSQLSGGEQQRVAIARAVVGRPALLLADEPTGNLDPTNAETVSTLLSELADEVGGTLIVVTHSRSLAAQMDVELMMSPGGALVEGNST